MKHQSENQQNIGTYSTFSELIKNDLEVVSDDSINAAYNYFDAERMKYYSNVYVKTDRNFRSRKDKSLSEWNDFAAVIRLCHKNNFHLRCYIKYCFINRLVPKAKGKRLADITYLRNYPQVIDYSRNKLEIERLYKIYNSIIKTIFLVKKLSSNESINAKTVIKNILNSGKLSEYITTGVISPYFLALLKNSSVIIHKYYDRFNDDNSIILDLCNRMEKYGTDSLKAMNMFYPSAMNKSIIQLCDNEVEK